MPAAGRRLALYCCCCLNQAASEKLLVSAAALGLPSTVLVFARLLQSQLDVLGSLVLPN